MAVAAVIRLVLLFLLAPLAGQAQSITIAAVPERPWIEQSPPPR